MVNDIVAENCLAGDTDWGITGAGSPNIQGFATEISVNRGQSVSFKVDTLATDYRLDIYRMGYYSGAGARKVTTIQPSASLPQVQPACLHDAPTGLVDCGNWAVSATWNVPPAATSGIYFAKLVRESVPPPEQASHIFFVVRDDDNQSDLLFKTSDSTWQAYNRYGGNSLYFGSPAGRAYKVSYNRPFDTRNHQAQSFVFNGEAPMVRFLERNGYDVSYSTSVDGDRAGSEILEHKVFLSVGHDEYWSGQQRANVEAARDAGVHLAFFSGNEVFWKTRWENSIDGSNTPYRTLVSYKETHDSGKIDPNPAWTGTWRDARFSPPFDGGRPENALTGTIFQVNGYESRSIRVPQEDGRQRFWRNTSAAALPLGGTLVLPDGTLGYEWDADLDNGFRPAGLIRLSTATYDVPAELKDNGSTYGPGTVTHHMTLHRRGNAIVFGAGTIQWGWGLDANHDFGGPPTSVDMQQATVNLLADMAVQPGTLIAGLIPASPSSDDTAPVSTIQSPAGGATLPAGVPVTISGVASDAVGLVGGVEVSVDGGTKWHPANGRENWTYEWTPTTSGPTVIRTRAVDDSGNIETPAAGTAVSVFSFNCPCSIWPLSATPSVASNPADGNAIELGVRFRSQVGGYITGVRFYKGPLNTGPHIGHLWNNDGTELLAEATFTSETTTGWQRVTFGSPVPIAANTTYIASYHTASGHYAVDRPYFSTATVTPPLQALADGQDGANGVFVYAAAPGGFPTQTFGSTNYWVDVEFVTSLANAVPTAANDLYSTTPDTTLTIPASGVLGNDTDDDAGTTLSAAVVSLPAHGTLALNANGAFNYTPQAAFTGEDSFTYRASDGQDNSNIATVTITVGTQATFNCPCSIWDPNTIPVVASNEDPNPIELGVRFRAQVSGYITGLRFYKGPQNVGPHIGHLWTNDGSQLLAQATFTNETVSGWQRVSFPTPIAVTANTTYVASYHSESGNYAVTRPYFVPTGRVNPPLEALADGQDGFNGVYLYVTAPGAFPSETFQSTNYWVDVEFKTSLSDTPPVAVADSYSVDEDTTLSVPAPGVLANDTDADPGTDLTAQLVSTTSHGSLTLNPDGSFFYTPQANFTGSDSFTYTASDGEASSAAVTVTITVNPINDAPAAVGEAYATAEDAPLVVNAPGVLANDTDIDGPSLVAAVLAPAAHGTVAMNANGSFTYTPSANYNGPDSFTYRAGDGSAFSSPATVTIAISPVNDPAVVNAGADQSVTMPASATLAGVVTDDGAFTSVWAKVAGPGTVTFGDANSPATTATFSLFGTYELMLTASDGQFVSSDTLVVTVNPANSAVRFDGVNDYVTFGPAAGPTKLGATVFTLETWFKRDGPGIATSTGSGGVTTAIPLVTKGRAEAEGSNVDMNYFLGIDSRTRVLVADFEDTASGLNHPALGTTMICDGVWYHAAATYDGTTWRLYLNGVLDSQVAVGSFTPRSDSIQHAGIGTAMTSTGLAAGFFQGTLDEVRIWNVARSAAEIQGTMAGPLATVPASLIGRWALNEAAGTTTADSSGRADTGTLTNGPAWVAGTPFVSTPPPAGNYGVKMLGTAAAGDYATFGAAPGLGAATFTVETWFRRDAAGVATSTGSGGVDAIPLLTKGRAEAEASTSDMNYFLGIRASDGVLVADFEEGAAGASPGLNHPIVGVTPIAIAPAVPTNADWHHAAVTYDGTTLRLYLDGVLERSLVVGQPPRFDSIQHAGLGTAFTSAGVAAGFFGGALDEARIWNYARSGADIATGRTREIVAAPGLLGRWGLNQCCLVQDSSGNNRNGTMSASAGWTWVAGAPFTGTINMPPVVDAGVDQAVTLPAAASLGGSVTDDGVSGQPVAVAWTKTSGPGTVVFGTPNATSTSASFNLAGTYVLTLTANDGEQAASDTITVVVSSPGNVPPSVNAGPDQILTLPTTTASLAGTVTDDGLPGGPVTTQWTKVSGPGTVTFGNAAAASTTATFSVQGAYVLQLTANDGAVSASDLITITVDSNPSNKAIDFGGTNAFVTFGPAPGLGASVFTVETWFRRDGAGVATNTGTGGVVAVPLVTKGMAEVEGSNHDMNYFLGIRQTDGVLAADFEDMATGLNHPVLGVTPIAANGAWHHAAASYDGTTWRLYLDGVLEAQLVVGAFTPRADSIQHAAIGTAFNAAGGITSGQTQGFFDGVIDEARIWNHARTLPQIARGRTHEITNAPGLLGRWGFDEGTGTVLTDSTGHAIHGTITGTNWAWVAGAPFSTQGNSAPVATADSASTTMQTAVTIAVLANDTDADGDALAVTTVGLPAHGAVVVNPAGTVTYTPVAGYSGPDGFTYAISDGQGGTASSAVVVEVGGLPNLAPVVEAGPDQALTFPAATATLSGTASDDGQPGTGLSTLWTKVSGPGTVTFGAPAALSTSATFSVLGVYVLRLTANDGALSTSDTLTITVDSNPPNKAIDFGGTNAYVTFGAAPGLGASTFTLETWFRRDGNGIATNTGTNGVIAVPLVSKGMAEAEGGTVDMNYFLGIRSSDNVLVADFEDTATGLNHPVAGTTAIPADGLWRHVAAVYDGTTWRLYLDGVLQTQLVVGAFTPQFNSIQHAALGTALNSTGGAGSQTQGFFDGVMDEARIWNYARSAQQIGRGRNYEISSAPGLLGRWSFNTGTGSVLADSSGHSINGTVTGTNWAWVAGAPFSTPGNTAPVAVEDTATTAEETAATIAVLPNDTDADGDTLTLTGVAAAAHGTTVANPNGTVTYTPAANYSGLDTFTYTITDSQGAVATGSVAVTVTSTNDAPAAVDDAYTTAEDVTLTVPPTGVVVNDLDPDGNTLTAIGVTVPAHGTLSLNTDGSFSYTPALNYSGPDSFTYKVSDGTVESNVATVTITVTAANDAPVAVNDAYTTAEDTALTVDAPGVLLNDSDVEGDAVSAIVLSGPTHGSLTLNADGSFIYAADANYSGSDSFSYMLMDDVSESNVATVTITVTAVNDGPVAVNDAATTAEDTAATIAVLANDTDVDGNVLSVTAVGVPAHGTAVANPDGTITYTPAANYNGPDSFTYTIGDGNGGTATRHRQRHGYGGQRRARPRSTTRRRRRRTRRSRLRSWPTTATSTATTLSVSNVSVPAHGAATLNPDKTIHLYAGADYNGTDSFTYTVSDGNGGTATATVTVTVTSVNDGPVAVSDTATTAEDTAATIAVLGNDTDADGNVSDGDRGQRARARHGRGEPGRQIHLHSGRELQRRATASPTRSATATAAARRRHRHRHGHAASTTRPVAVNDTAATAEDTAVSDRRPGQRHRRRRRHAVGGHRRRARARHRHDQSRPDGSFTYTPALNYNGADSFTYTISDGSGGTATSRPST